MAVIATIISRMVAAPINHRNTIVHLVMILASTLILPTHALKISFDPNHPHSQHNARVIRQHRRRLQEHGIRAVFKRVNKSSEITGPVDIEDILSKSGQAIQVLTDATAHVVVHNLSKPHVIWVVTASTPLDPIFELRDELLSELQFYLLDAGESDQQIRLRYWKVVPPYKEYTAIITSDGRDHSVHAGYEFEALRDVLRAM